ncbi:hypothetical protein AX17_007138 [Amanita inopinata Kibby_2008]|nr:hypothetical protein AX17_007138 [Amanita inopinata Kibby_2008]
MQLMTSLCAVPRTFVGSVLLAWISTPVIALANTLGFVSSKFDLQLIVRLVLASLNAVGLCYLRRAISRRFSFQASVFFVLLTCSQFHLPFWMGRTLPNMFALLPVNISTALLVRQNPIATIQLKRAYKIAIALLTFATVVFRAEIALLLGPLVVQTLITRKLSFSEIVRVGLFVGFTSIALTTLIDSYFWNAFPLWPELHGVYFNVYQGKSAEWGTSPPLTYVKNYLPKLLLGSLPLSLVGAVVDSRIRTLLFPSVAFISLISRLGHKEWRFIIYVVPIFNVAAARGAQYLCTRRTAVVGRAFVLLTTSLITANVLVTVVLTFASLWNYPGGEALALLHKRYPTSYKPTPHVHISNLAAQTGASLFLQLNSPPYPPYLLSTNNYDLIANPWVYNKTEHLTSRAISSSHQITHLISENDPINTDRDALTSTFTPVASIWGFDRWSVDKDALVNRRGELMKRPWEIINVARMKKSKKLWILERTAP